MNCVMCKKEVTSDKGYYKMSDVCVCFECAAKYTLDAIFIRVNNEMDNEGVYGIESVYVPPIAVDMEYKNATPEQVEAFFTSEHETPEFCANTEVDNND